MLDPQDQIEYWDKVAWDKVFTHPLNLPLLQTQLPLNSRILDYGCGYGRACQALAQAGYTQVLGVDSSAEMIRRGLQQDPSLALEVLPASGLPYPPQTFDAILLIAVLTCIPVDEDQRNLLTQLTRRLRPGGLLYISDYRLQEDERNQSRYRAGLSEFGTYGVFRLPEGVVLRHHSIEWLETLTRDFKRLDLAYPEVITMNGHRAKAFQYLGQLSM